jgi:lipopolysaccharide/colanic/teichoic acid biosynthesis glycosyltransferase
VVGVSRRVSRPVRTASDAVTGDPDALVSAGGRLADRTLLRWGVRPLVVAVDVAGFAAAAALTGPVTGGSLVLLALVVALYSSAGLYRSRLSLSALDDLPALAGRALAAAAIATTAGVVLDVPAAGAPLLLTAAVMAIAVVVLRALAYATVRRVGFLDSDPLLRPGERPVPLLGGHESLASVIVEFGVHDVIVAFGSEPESRMVDIIRTCDRLNCEIFFVPRLFELQATGRDVDQVWGLPLVRLRRAPFRSMAWRLKRAIDVAAATVALVLVSPVLLACALAVYAEGGPGILFSQERVGLDGRPFRLLKFRSMKPATEADSTTLWSIAGDDRVGPVGRFLRTTSLDELPQLWNILRGDMSLVGPRPERPHFVEQFTRTLPRYTARHRVPAGLTGWAQVHGLRGDTSIEDRARFDNCYIESWSLWGDVKIMLRTVVAMLRGSGR